MTYPTVYKDIRFSTTVGEEQDLLSTEVVAVPSPKECLAHSDMVEEDREIFVDSMSMSYTDEPGETELMSESLGTS